MCSPKSLYSSNHNFIFASPLTAPLTDFFHLKQLCSLAGFRHIRVRQLNSNSVRPAGTKFGSSWGVYTRLCFGISKVLSPPSTCFQGSSPLALKLKGNVLKCHILLPTHSRNLTCVNTMFTVLIDAIK